MPSQRVLLAQLLDVYTALDNLEGFLSAAKVDETLQELVAEHNTAEVWEEVQEAREVTSVACEYINWLVYPGPKGGAHASLAKVNIQFEAFVAELLKIAAKKETELVKIGAKEEKGPDDDKKTALATKSRDAAKALAGDLKTAYANHPNLKQYLAAPKAKPEYATDEL